MTELPQEKAKSFGLGPRQFNRSSGPKPKQDRSWTETPEMKAKRAALAASGIVVPGMLFSEKVLALVTPNLWPACDRNSKFISIHCR